MHVLRLSVITALYPRASSYYSEFCGEEYTFPQEKHRLEMLPCILKLYLVWKTLTIVKLFNAKRHGAFSTAELFDCLSQKLRTVVFINPHI